MADLQKDKNGKNIVYPGTKSGDDIADSANKDSSLYLFLNGGVGSDGQNYPKVDMSLYDYATMWQVAHIVA